MAVSSSDALLLEERLVESVAVEHFCELRIQSQTAKALRISNCSGREAHGMGEEEDVIAEGHECVLHALKRKRVFTTTSRTNC